MYQLNIIEILIKGHNGIESVISCKSKNVEVIEVYESKVFDMTNHSGNSVRMRRNSRKKIFWSTKIFMINSACQGRPLLTVRRKFQSCQDIFAG